MIEMNELLAQVDTLIPAKCEGCAVQCVLGAELLNLLIEKAIILEVGERLMGDLGENIDRFLDENVATEDADHMKHIIRQGSVRSLDETYQAINDKEDQINAASRSCVGPLKMRASKNNVIYTAAVCTAQTEYVRGGKNNHVPTHIKTN
jgi:hypothetical protein